jgi:hypothetical protein
MKPTRTVNSDGAIEYKLPNGERHREDGPAYEHPTGTKSWYLNGLLHRENGPAIEWTSGTKEWWLNDERHREDGPAYEGSNGINEWYLNGKNLSQREFLKITRNNKLNIL